MPTVSEYEAFQEASAEVQQNMTFYYNSSASLQTWSAVSEEGSAALSPVFGDVFGEGQSNYKEFFTLCYVCNNVYVENVISYVIGILEDNAQIIFTCGMAMNLEVCYN